MAAAAPRIGLAHPTVVPTNFVPEGPDANDPDRTEP
jgi:hypothetical protein